MVTPRRAHKSVDSGATHRVLVLAWRSCKQPPEVQSPTFFLRRCTAEPARLRLFFIIIAEMHMN